MVFDGLILDDGFANSYHETKGKPADLDTGMWLEGPAWNKTRDKFPSANRYLVYTPAMNRATGAITFRNCAFVNAGNIAFNINWYKGKVTTENCVFFLNRESDVQMTVSPSVVKVRVDGFEDLEGVDGIESIEDNEDLKDPAIFKDRLEPKYLNNFLTMKYSESTKLDEGKCNGLRSMLGLPLQGTITTKCDMFCNRYPLDWALKLFGAMKGQGAQ